MRSLGFTFLELSMIVAGIPHPVPGQMTPDEANTVEVFQAASLAVVHVKATRLTPTNVGAPALALGAGSGFFIDEVGHVLTNYHVIEGSKSLELLMGDGQVLAAQLVGTAQAMYAASLNHSTVGRNTRRSSPTRA